MTLAQQPKMELMVVNPAQLCAISLELIRGGPKPDAVDAQVLLEYSQRMRLQPSATSGF